MPLGPLLLARSNEKRALPTAHANSQSSGYESRERCCPEAHNGDIDESRNELHVEDQQEKEKRKGNDIFGGETLYPHININVLPSHPVTELERSVRSRPNKVSVSVVYGRGDHQVWNTR